MSSHKLHSFLAGLAEALELDDSALTPETKFTDISWDSLAVISAIALVDEHFGIMLSGQEISECTDFSDLLLLINSRSS